MLYSLQPLQLTGLGATHWKQRQRLWDRARQREQSNREPGGDRRVPPAGKSPADYDEQRPAPRIKINGGCRRTRGALRSAPHVDIYGRARQPPDKGRQ